MRLASSSEKSMEETVSGAAGNLRKGSGMERKGGRKRLLGSKLFAAEGWPFAEEFGLVAGVPWDEGGEGGLPAEGAGEGRWKPSWRERTCGLYEVAKKAEDDMWADGGGEREEKE